MKVIQALLCVLVGCLSACSKQEEVAVSEEEANPPSPEVDAVDGVPFAIPVKGKEGFVQSPYAPEKGFVDLRGFPRGTQVKDPYTGKVFLVP